MSEWDEFLGPHITAFPRAKCRNKDKTIELCKQQQNTNEELKKKLLFILMLPLFDSPVYYNIHKQNRVYRYNTKRFFLYQYQGLIMMVARNPEDLDFSETQILIS